MNRKIAAAVGFVFCMGLLTACIADNKKGSAVSDTDLTALNNRIALLEDKEEIRDLTARFSNLADEKDADSQALLFTEDAVVEINFAGQHSELSGRDEIAETFGSVVNSMDALYHMNGQADITVNGDTAEGTVYCRVVLINNNVLTDEAVTYKDEYVRQDGKWLISKRVSDFVFTDSHEMTQGEN